MLRHVVRCLRKLYLLYLTLRDGKSFGQLNVWRLLRTKYLVLKNALVLKMVPVYCLALVEGLSETDS